MSTLDDLLSLRELLTPHGNWITGGYAQNSRGLPVPSTDPTACKWCLVGGINKVTNNRSDLVFNSLAWNLYRALMRARRDDHRYESLEAWNDRNVLKAAVLSLIDDAIAIEMERIEHD